MKKVLGGKENTCNMCGGMTVYLDIKRIGTVSQCKACGNMVTGRAKDKIKIYAYEDVR